MLKASYDDRRITLELNKRGYTVNYKKVKRLISVMGLNAITSQGKYRSYKNDMNEATKNLLLTK